MISCTCLNGIVFNSKQISAELQNAGKDCLGNCNQSQGKCPWCGSCGWCCTMKPGWTNTSNGCDGTFGGVSKHECVLKPGRVLFLLKYFIVCYFVYYAPQGVSISNFIF